LRKPLMLREVEEVEFVLWGDRMEMLSECTIVRTILRRVEWRFGSKLRKHKPTKCVMRSERGKLLTQAGDC
jgi:hypothetical protein